MLQTKCSFCGDKLQPGTGKMYVKSDGTIYVFCSRKCEVNMLTLGRTPARIRWTEAWESAKKKKEE